MLKLNGSVNCGFCQGITRGPVRVVAPDVVSLTVLVTDRRVNPKTNKEKTYLLNFIARGELAAKLSKITKKERLILINYHLEQRFKFDKKLGIGRFETQFEIDDFCYKEVGKGVIAPFLNRGLYQCTFLGISRIINTKNVYFLDTSVKDKETGKRIHLSFMVFGSYGEIIQKEFIPGQEITIDFKLERRKSTLYDGSVERFTNCVVEKIV